MPLTSIFRGASGSKVPSPLLGSLSAERELKRVPTLPAYCLRLLDGAEWQRPGNANALGIRACFRREEGGGGPEIKALHDSRFHMPRAESAKNDDIRLLGRRGITMPQKVAITVNSKKQCNKKQSKANQLKASQPARQPARQPASRQKSKAKPPTLRVAAAAAAGGWCAASSFFPKGR